MSQSVRGRGFTIIEVVIVLAIAGLIFVIVFMAVPALQRSQRDQQRRQDMGVLLGAVNTWSANNKGNVLDSDAELQNVASNYFLYADPSTGAPYTLLFNDVMTPHNMVVTPPEGSIAYVVGHICGDDGTGTLITGDPNAPNHTAKRFAILISLETNPKGLCLDNR